MANPPLLRRRHFSTPEAAAYGYYECLLAGPGRRGVSRTRHACPHRPGDRHPAVFDKRPAATAFLSVRAFARRPEPSGGRRFRGSAQRCAERCAGRRPGRPAWRRSGRPERGACRLPPTCCTFDRTQACTIGLPTVARHSFTRARAGMRGRSLLQKRRRTSATPADEGREQTPAQRSCHLNASRRRR